MSNLLSTWCSFPSDQSPNASCLALSIYLLSQSVCSYRTKPIWRYFTRTGLFIHILSYYIMSFTSQWDTFVIFNHHIVIGKCSQTWFVYLVTPDILCSFENNFHSVPIWKCKVCNYLVISFFKINLPYCRFVVAVFE